jgi:hypothetical protein
MRTPAKEEDCWPYGVYDTKQQMLVHIGLYSDEARCWQIFLGWPDQEEIEWYKKEKGLRVIPLTVSYDPKRVS